jgi:regulatory protein
VAVSVRQAVLNLLARREYSRYELSQKLQKKHYDTHDIEDTLDDFSRRGWQSDERFIESYVRHRSKAGVGPLKIAHELRRKKVDSAQVERFLNAGEVDWDACIRNVWCKKFNQVPGGFSVKSKQMRFLLQRGFEPDRVQQLLKYINKDDTLCDL